MSEETEVQKKSQFSIALVLSLIALAGVVILFVFYFGGKQSVDENGSQNMPVLSGEHNSIVFVNSDEILQKYELVKKLSDQLDKERKDKNDDFKARQKAYEDDASYFQEQVQKQAIAEKDAQRIYEQLMVKQQQLSDLQDKYASELSQKEYEMNTILLDSVRNYLTRLNKKYNYDYILSYNSAGNIFFAKDTFDITQQVLNGLNNEYFKENPVKK